MHGKTAASVLLKLFISGNERYHWRPLAHDRDSVNNPWCLRTFYSRHTGTNHKLWCVTLNWEKGKTPGSIACIGKQQPQFYWSCSLVVMKDVTPPRCCFLVKVMLPDGCPFHQFYFILIYINERRRKKTFKHIELQLLAWNNAHLLIFHIYPNISFTLIQILFSAVSSPIFCKSNTYWNFLCRHIFD